MNNQIPKNRQVKKIHHYVWAYYLKNWSNDGKNVWRRTKKNNKVEMYSVRGMLYEDYFYKMNELDDDHIRVINYLFLKSDPKQKKLISDFIHVNRMLQKCKNSLRIENLKSHEYENEIFLLMSNTLENHHSSIERDAVPIMDQLALGNFSILESDKNMLNFIIFLSHQITRTKAFKQNILNNIKKHDNFFGKKLEECWWIVSYFIGINIGNHLYLSRKTDKHTLLINNTVEPFITSDQPVINIHSALDSKIAQLEEDQMDLYYPISPNIAYVIHNSQTFESGKINITFETACELNEKMAKNANIHIIGNNEEIINKYKKLTGYWVDFINE